MGLKSAMVQWCIFIVMCFIVMGLVLYVKFSLR
jgi:hypothetical protein